MASRGINKVILIGNLGSDPEVRYMPSGGAVANVNIATSETWKDKQTGEQRERTEWHRVVFYQKLAEIVGEYLKKGSKVYVEGRLSTRKWQKDGQDHYTTEIIANDMQMLDSRSGGTANFSNDRERDQGGHSQGNANAPAQSRSNAPSEQPAPPPSYDDFDDDVPF